MKPQALRIAFYLWIVAIAAGVFETLLVVASALFDDASLSGGEDFVPGVIIRLIIFSIMTFVAVQMYKGKNWARFTISILLGILGLLSLIIQPVMWLLEGHAITDAFTSLNIYSALFMTSRMLHVVAVIGATILMFLPSSNIYFRHK